MEIGKLLVKLDTEISSIGVDEVCRLYWFFKEANFKENIIFDK